MYNITSYSACSSDETLHTDSGNTSSYTLTEIGIAVWLITLLLSASLSWRICPGNIGPNLFVVQFGFYVVKQWQSNPVSNIGCSFLLINQICIRYITSGLASYYIKPFINLQFTLPMLISRILLLAISDNTILCTVILLLASF